MATIYLDSNILISLKVNNHAFQSAALNLMADFFINHDKLFVTSLGLDEIWWGIKKDLISKGLPLDNLEKDIEELIIDLKKRGVEFIQFKRLSVYKGSLLATKYGKLFSLRPRDSFHLAIMQDHKIRDIASFDADFDRITVLNIRR